MRVALPPIVKPTEHRDGWIVLIGFTRTLGPFLGRAVAVAQARRHAPKRHIVCPTCHGDGSLLTDEACEPTVSA